MWKRQSSPTGLVMDSSYHSSFCLCLYLENIIEEAVSIKYSISDPIIGSSYAITYEECLRLVGSAYCNYS